MSQEVFLMHTAVLGYCWILAVTRATLHMKGMNDCAEARRNIWRYPISMHSYWYSMSSMRSAVWPGIKHGIITMALCMARLDVECDLLVRAAWFGDSGNVVWVQLLDFFNIICSPSISSALRISPTTWPISRESCMHVRTVLTVSCNAASSEHVSQLVEWSISRSTLQRC